MCEMPGNCLDMHVCACVYVFVQSSLHASAVYIYIYIYIYTHVWRYSYLCMEGNFETIGTNRRWQCISMCTCHPCNVPVPMTFFDPTRRNVRDILARYAVLPAITHRRKLRCPQVGFGGDIVTD